MCGRFDCHSSIEVIKKTFGSFACEAEYQPNYNVAPSQAVLVMNKDAGRQLMTCRWGFVPSWIKDISPGKGIINARAETVASKPAFSTAFREHRCLVIADGFYEWRKEGKKRVPVYVRLRSGMPFGIAGLYNSGPSAKGEYLCTSTIITTNANDLLSDLHNRMPAIVPKEKEDFWLDPGNKDFSGLLAMLEPYPSDEMEFYEVSTRVNAPGYNYPDNIIPLSPIS